MIFEYKCKECEKITELSCMLKVRPDMLTCECGKNAYRLEVPTKLGGISFKGSGFYSTDNGPKGE